MRRIGVVEPVLSRCEDLDGTTIRKLNNGELNNGEVNDDPAFSITFDPESVRSDRRDDRPPLDPALLATSRAASATARIALPDNGRRNEWRAIP